MKPPFAAIIKTMPDKSANETLKALAWVEERGNIIKPFLPEASCEHPCLWFDTVMTNIADGVRDEDQAAIRLAAQFIGDSFNVPFGKIIRTKLLKRLKKVTMQIPSEYRQAICSVPEKFANKPYKPQEYRDLIRLVEAINRNSQPTNASYSSLAAAGSKR